MSPGHAVAAPEAASARIAQSVSATPRSTPKVGPSPFGPHPGSELDRLTLQRAFAGVGRPVDAARRAHVEGLTGQDLSRVRLHTGAAVRVAALAAGASAFTVGHDVGIATGPDQAIPERLLTHELVHAAQQRAAGDATPAQAEQQAREVDAGMGAATMLGGGGGGGGLAGTGRSYVAYAAEDWLQSTPDVRSYGYSALLDELNEIDEWLDRQISSSPEADRMHEARAEIEAEITRRQGAMAEQDRPRRRRRRGRGAASVTAGGARQTEGVARPTHTEGAADSAHSQMPRILREQTSTQITDPAEIRAEIDRITAWLERPDLGGEDRAILRQELAVLALGLSADLARASGERRQTRLARALNASAAPGRAGVLENLRTIESIRPYPEQPGMAYVLHEGELLVFPQELAESVRAETLSALRDAAARARSMNDSTQFRMDAHLRLNYEEHPVVGFVVSVISGEEPVDLQRRMLDPLSDSRIALSAFERAATQGSLSAMGDAVFTAVEKADEANTIVSEGVDRAIAAAGSAVTGLTITRDLAFTVSLAIGAIVAAPVVASGVAGLGATGLTATGLTAAGTSGVVGTGGFALGFAGGAGGELAAGGGADRALSAGMSEGRRVGAEGAVSGLGGGLTLGLTRNLGLGATGLTRSETVWRSALAQGGGGGLSGAVGGYLSAPEGERGRSMFLGGLSGFGLGALGGASGTWASDLGSPALRYGVGVGIPAVGDTGVTYLRTGDWGQAFRAGGLGLATGTFGQRRSALGTTPGEVRAHQFGQSAAQFGRSAARTGRAYAAAAGLGLFNSSAAFRMGDSGGSFSLRAPDQGAYVLRLDDGGQGPVAQRTAAPGPADPAPAAAPAPAPAAPAAVAQQPELSFAGLVDPSPASVPLGNVAIAAREATHVPVDVRLGSHASARTVRAEFGVTGAQFESAHILAQTMGTAINRVLPGRYRPGRALAVLLPPAAHRAFDRGWVRLWNQRVASGQRTTVADARGLLNDALGAVPPSLLSYREQGALSSALDHQLFTILDLDPTLVLFGGP